MEKSNIMIRLEKKEEYQKVENLVRESFWNVYRPGCLEHYVLHQLRNDPAFVPELDFVMLLNENDEDGKLIGQNMFMRTSIKADDGRNIPIMTMGPICITPELKRQGYGMAEITAAIEDSHNGVNAVLPPPPPSSQNTQSPTEDQFAMQAGEDDFDDDLTDEDKTYLRFKWGKAYRPEEWVKLEQLYEEMMNSYDIQGAGHIDNLKLLCKTSLKANQLIDMGD